MNRDIVKWTMEEASGFRIPVNALWEYLPELRMVGQPQNGPVEIVHGPLKLKGELVAGGDVVVGTMACKGKGSGEFYNTTLEPVLHESSGSMTALVHWEGESNPVKVTVEDGDVYEVFVN